MLKTKDLFFDSPKVLRAVDKATRQALVPIGAEIRTKAQRSMRPARRLRAAEITPDIAESMGLPREGYAEIIRRSKPKLPYAASAPGEPPRTRKNKTLRRLLFFSWDPIAKSVVAGPERFAEGTAPRDLELGGTSKLKTYKRTAPKTRSTPAQRRGLAKARAAGKIRRRTSKRRPRQSNATTTTITIKKRPYMLPQLQAIAPRIPRQFSGVVK